MHIGTLVALLVVCVVVRIAMMKLKAAFARDHLRSLAATKEISIVSAALAVATMVIHRSEVCVGGLSRGAHCYEHGVCNVQTPPGSRAPCLLYTSDAADDMPYV